MSATASAGTRGFAEERHTRHTIVLPEQLERSIARVALHEHTSPNAVIMRFVAKGDVLLALPGIALQPQGIEGGLRVHRTISWPEHVERSLEQIAMKQQATVNDVIQVCVSRGLAE